jgi:hypothetical protein
MSPKALAPSAHPPSSPQTFGKAIGCFLFTGDAAPDMQIPSHSPSGAAIMNPAIASTVDGSKLSILVSRINQISIKFQDDGKANPETRPSKLGIYCWGLHRPNSNNFGEFVI